MGVIAETSQKPLALLVHRLWQDHRVWLVSAAVLAGLFVVSPAQGADSAVFVARNLVQTFPYILLSIGLAAWLGATGADGLVSRAFVGSPVLMIFLAALAGGAVAFLFLRGDPPDCRPAQHGGAAVCGDGLLAGLAGDGPFHVPADQRRAGG
nr:hypothetical protein [Sneathiella chinensis]